MMMSAPDGDHVLVRVQVGREVVQMVTRLDGLLPAGEDFDVNELPKSMPDWAVLARSEELRLSRSQARPCDVRGAITRRALDGVVSMVKGRLCR